MTATATLAVIATAILGVYDGDTVYLGDGTRGRIVAIDAPEMQGKCPAERMLAINAAAALEDLIASGHGIAERTGGTCGWDRPCVSILLDDGTRAEDLLLEWNLAVPWSGERHDWCGGAE